MHPSQTIHAVKSDLLEGRIVIYGVTGSIAAVESVRVIREIIRHGAEVHVVATRDALEIVGKKALEFASGRRVIDEITGMVEHVDLGDRADAMIIAPASANTMAKISAGIADTPVTLFASNVLGRAPLLMAPSMHSGMYGNPVMREAMERLRGLGVIFIDPREEEGKEKMPPREVIAAHLLHAMRDELRGRRIAVVGGAGHAEIDDVRVITNRSTGRTAVEIARWLFYLGADVTLYMGRCEVSLPEYVCVRRFTTLESLMEMRDEIAAHDAVVVPAALPDFAPDRVEGKLPGEAPLTLHLRPLPKFLSALREVYDGPLIGFKAESGVDRSTLVKRARKRMEEHNLTAVVANDVRKVSDEHTEAVWVSRDGEESFAGSKADLGRWIAWKIAGILGTAREA